MDTTDGKAAQWAKTFTANAYFQTHARRWAASYYGEDCADLFVAWLMTMDDEEQARVIDGGYLIINREFERAYPDLRG